MDHPATQTRPNVEPSGAREPAPHGSSPFPFQGEAFLDAWAATRGRELGSRIVRLLATDEAGAEIAVPIEVVRLGLLAIGRFPGETHANAGAPLAAARGRLDLRAAARRAGLDALDLRRVPDPGWLPADALVVPAAEQRFAITLAGGLAAVLERGNGKRKRKKFRSQQRHFAVRGGYRFELIERERRSAAIDVFLQHKSERFAALAMPDPFREAGVAAFLKRFFVSGDADVRLYAVESADRIKALMGGIAAGDTFWGMFSAFADDEDAEASPGELLIWHLVETLGEEGLARLDLGPGEERYKRSWCDVVVPQVDAALAVTAKGRVYLAAFALGRSAVRRIKSDAVLHARVQHLRRWLRRS